MSQLSKDQNSSKRKQKENSMTIEQDKKEGEGDETRKSVLGDKFGAAIKALIMKKVQENNDLRKVEKAENPRKIEH